MSGPTLKKFQQKMYMMEERYNIVQRNKQGSTLKCVVQERKGTQEE